MDDSSLGKDLMQNFATWPSHVQASFLEILSRSAAEHSTPDMMSVRNLIGAYQVSLREHQLRTEAILKELQENAKFADLLRDSLQEMEILHLLQLTEDLHQRILQLLQDNTES